MSIEPFAGSFRERGGGWVVAQAGLMLAVLVMGVTSRGEGSNPPLLATGALLIVVGGYFGITGVRGLGRNRTPFPRPLPEGELVQTGIYGRVRHPLYTSVILVSLGWALVWQSRPALGVAGLLIPFFYAKARREERWLAARFPGYGEYAQRVPRFIPRWKQASPKGL